jgi:hypothetical protein
MRVWLHDHDMGALGGMMAKIFSLGSVAILALFFGVSEQAHGEDASFCGIFKQYFADRTSAFMDDRGERARANQDIWDSKQSFPDMKCSVGEQYVQCKYIDPGVMGQETLLRHKTMAAKIDDCIPTIPGFQKAQLKRMHDTDTRGTVFVLSEGWEVDDGIGTYSISLVRSGLVLIYTPKH